MFDLPYAKYTTAIPKKGFGVVLHMKLQRIVARGFLQNKVYELYTVQNITILTCK
jgi:hypothetical protein